MCHLDTLGVRTEKVDSLASLSCLCDDILQKLGLWSVQATIRSLHTYLCVAVDMQDGDKSGGFWCLLEEGPEPVQGLIAKLAWPPP